METNRIKKAIAILLLVCFLVSLTATAVSAVSFDSKKTFGKTTTIVEMSKEKYTYGSNSGDNDLRSEVNGKYTVTLSSRDGWDIYM